MFKKIFLILIPVILIITASISYFKPDFNLWSLGKSLVLRKQRLPLPAMFLPEQKGRFVVSSLEPEFVLAGPNTTLFGGQYEYELEITPACEGKKIGYLDVVRDSGRLGFGAKELMAQKNNQSQTEKVVFENEGIATSWEFRLYSSGQCPFEITGGTLTRQRSDFRGFLRQLKKIIVRGKAEN